MCAKMYSKKLVNEVNTQYVQNKANVHTARQNVISNIDIQTIIEFLSWKACPVINKHTFFYLVFAIIKTVFSDYLRMY